jgi:hypothetical protein
MKFPFFKNFWHNVGYLLGSLLISCLLLAIAGAALVALLKFFTWLGAL